MIDKILDRYGGRDKTNGVNGTDQADETEIDDFGCFGFLRGSRERAVMLELRKKNGNILAVGYGWLERVEYDPSIGITLHAADRKVQIRGRNLNGEAGPKIKLFESIARHRVPWIKEFVINERMQAPLDTTVIDGIEW